MPSSPIDFHSIEVPTGVPGLDRTDAYLPSLPGIVIFVHGVNSDGEWYDAAEEGLIRGLNKRLGRDRAQDPRAQLQPARYRRELLPDGRLNQGVDGLNFIEDPGFSPVIRFRWGYRAAPKDGTADSIDELKEYAPKIYLNELDAWGGGPFQNGTTALPYMWGEGIDDRVFWWFYLNMFPIEGREIYASPPRAYFVHAAHRLKELIKAIRDKQRDCPITVVCHSQGNMVTMAAALLGEQEAALADTYVLCNPPYSLEALLMDDLANHNMGSGLGQRGAVTQKARVKTFAHFLKAVRECAERQQQPLDLINRYIGFDDPHSGERVFRLERFPDDVKAAPVPGQDRDNRGRVFLYCNPHDQVIGVSPVQGIGWRGVSQAQLDAVQAEGGRLHQRVWAASAKQQPAPFKVGCPHWTGRDYRYRQDNHDPHTFWHPAPPSMRYVGSFNAQQSWIAKVATVVTAPFLLVATRVMGLSVNAMPAKDWAVPINAPVLPEPVVPKARRYGADHDFDEGKDPARDALARSGDPDKLRDDPYGDVLQQPGLGDAGTEAAYRYELRARLRMAENRGSIPKDDPQAQRQTLQRLLAENPNATDHSTILTQPLHAEKVLAYDVALGWVDWGRITAADMQLFRTFAHWVMVKDTSKEWAVANPFRDYWKRGFMNELQLQRTYTPQHMLQQAPGIADERHQSLLGHLGKGAADTKDKASTP